MARRYPNLRVYARLYFEFDFNSSLELEVKRLPFSWPLKSFFVKFQRYICR